MESTKPKKPLRPYLRYRKEFLKEDIKKHQVCGFKSRT